MANQEQNTQSQSGSNTTGSAGTHTGTTGDAGVTGTGSAGSATGGVSGNEQSQGTTSGAVPTVDVDSDAVGGGSTLSEGMASGANGGMAVGTGGGEALGTGEASDHTTSWSDHGNTSADGRRDREEAGFGGYGE
jgi:hypothetical protein